MKKIISILALIASLHLQAQDKFFTKTGKIEFDATVAASPEKIEGVNRSVTCVIDTKNGNIQFSLLMKGFLFERALMEEHFNENYVESDRFPKAIFKGKVEGFDSELLTAVTKDFVLNGKLELHGKSVPVKTIAKISKSAAGINLMTNFSVNASDFNIAIPSVVKNKVSNKINIQVAAVLK